jgi:S-adenosylmethionine:tRNA ribosyltransferase-isomerase
VRTDDFEFDLPPELIAQDPVTQRDRSRLLLLRRNPTSLHHHLFTDLLQLLIPGDVLVINDSRVLAGRLHGINDSSGGRFEILLLEENQPNNWWAMTKPGRRARPGTVIRLLDQKGCATEITAVTQEVNAEGHRRFQFLNTPNILNELPRLGEVPLPPYIKRRQPRLTDIERYQTVYANDGGSLAAPTAGLHFTSHLIDQLQARGIEVIPVTLHVGLGTFAPVKAGDPEDHIMHEERFLISESAADRLNRARAEQRRIIAVGTTSLRVLETVGRAHAGRLMPGAGRTRIFIRPPCTFSIVSGLITNFHLPRSTLLMLVCAFATPGETRGCSIVLDAYATAVRERYRFFSYGDAMLIL